MVQFAEVFPEFKIVSPLVSQLGWTHLIILMTLPTDEARLFYARLAIESKWSKRELQRQIERKAFERAEIVENGWWRHILALAIKSDLFARQGKAISNFKATLLSPL